MSENVVSNGTSSLFNPRLDLELPAYVDSYEKLHEFSLEHNDLFWSTLARKRLQWFKDFDVVCNTRTFTCEDFHLKWFIGGKLNVAGEFIDFI